MKTKFLLFCNLLFLTFIYSSAQTWLSGSGKLYTSPTSTKIGIGTTSPSGNLHIKASTYPQLMIEETDKPYRWQLVGYLGGLAIAQENVAWRLFCSDDGNVGIGTTFPAGKLHVAGFTQIDGGFISDESGDVKDYLYCDILVERSDKRLKKDIAPLQKTKIDNIYKLQGYDYNLTKNTKEEQRKIGLIAQEISEYYPELVTKDNEGYFAVNYSGLIPILIEAIKQQNEEINTLKSILNVDTVKIKNTSNYSVSNSDLINNKKTNKSFLFQNQPNPFNESTTIKYYFDENFSEGSILIYSTNGEFIMNEKNLRPGTGEFIFETKELNPGVYIYSLIIDNQQVDSKTMVLTK